MARSSTDNQNEFRAIRDWDPKVHALIDFDESAARRRIAAAGPGPLAGWSVAVKDIIDWAGTPTRCGADFVPAPIVQGSAAIVEHLESLGAFVMAKAVTTTFAFFDAGPTRNPWHLQHTPGGSSSGSAAAVACGMVRLGLGSQTVASVNRPAAFCGVVGFKPTLGRFDTRGVFPVSPAVDTLGFFTADTEDARAAFAAMQDEEPAPQLAKLRVGMIADMRCDPADADMIQAVDGVAQALGRAGHEVRTEVLSDEFAVSYEDHWTLVAAQCAESHASLFAEHGDRYPPKLRELIERGRRITAEQRRAIDARRRRTIEVLDALFDRFDVLLSPSAPGAAPRGIKATGDPRMSLLWTYTGVPSLTLPAALSRDGLPLGVQLAGRRMEDDRLLAAGVAVEKLIAFREVPRGSDATT